MNSQGLQSCYESYRLIFQVRGLQLEDGLRDGYLVLSGCHSENPIGRWTICSRECYNNGSNS